MLSDTNKSRTRWKGTLVSITVLSCSSGHSHLIQSYYITRQNVRFTNRCRRLVQVRCKSTRPKTLVFRTFRKVVRCIVATYRSLEPSDNLSDCLRERHCRYCRLSMCHVKGHETVRLTRQTQSISGGGGALKVIPGFTRPTTHRTDSPQDWIVGLGIRTTFRKLHETYHVCLVGSRSRKLSIYWNVHLEPLDRADVYVFTLTQLCIILRTFSSQRNKTRPKSMTKTW